MRTDLEEDENLVDICDSNSGITTQLHVRIREDKKIYHYSQRNRSIDCSTIGKIFITNKRVIFEASNEEENSQDHFFYHKDIEITNGRNGRYLPPIPGRFTIFPFKEIDWADGFRSSVFYERVDARANLNEFKSALGYEYFNTSYGGDLSNKLNNEFYSPHKERVDLYLKDKEKRLEKYIKKKEQIKLQKTLDKAKRHEKLLEFDAAAEIYKELMMDDDVIRVRKLKSEQGAVKVDQTVVHGDQITKTEIKDSVLNRSNVGSGGGSSKAEELREAKSLFEEGLIDDDEFKQMKKEIMGK